MIALICFVLAVLASLSSRRAGLRSSAGSPSLRPGLSFRYTHEGIWLSRAILQVSHNRRFAPQYFATRQTVRQKTLLPLWANQEYSPTTLAIDLDQQSDFSTREYAGCLCNFMGEKHVSRCSIRSQAEPRN